MNGFTLWFTGLPCSGKTTLARKMESYFRERSRNVEVLDGDIVRVCLTKGLGFSKEDRNENVRRVGFVCNLLSRNGIIAIAALVSPYEESREEVRSRVKNFVLVYLKCSLDMAIKRDPKGNYKKALKGEIEKFTGISDPYQPPRNPDITIETDNISEDKAIETIVGQLRKLGFTE